MEQYLLDKLLEEAASTTLFDDEGKEALKEFILTHNEPLYDAELTELLQTLMDFRMKEEAHNAQSYSIVREHIDPLLMKIKENQKLTEEETKELLDSLSALKDVYHKALIKDS